MHRPSALLIVRPRLLRDSLRHHLERDAGLRVVRELALPHDALEAVGESNTGMVIQAFGGQERQQAKALCRQLLACFPGISVISVDLVREQVYLSSAARACVTRRFTGIGDVIAAVRLWLETGESGLGAFAGASAEQFIDSGQ